MTWLFNQLLSFLRLLVGYITGFLGYCFNYIYQFLAYIFVTILEWLLYAVSWIFIILVYIIDYLLQIFVNIINAAFGGDLFGVAGVVTSTIENNLQAVLAIAPYAKMVGYVLNVDALVGCFRGFLAFIILWTCYRYLRLWLRG